ncbi:MAG: alcohol dehydrogenase catalytic domain-containing protein, partial [Candidatus Bathyarchaeia archaeon]
MVKNVKISDEVIVSPGLSCGICYECQVGYNNCCKN